MSSDFKFCIVISILLRNVRNLLTSLLFLILSNFTNCSMSVFIKSCGFPYRCFNNSTASKQFWLVNANLEIVSYADGHENDFKELNLSMLFIFILE